MKKSLRIFIIIFIILIVFISIFNIRLRNLYMGIKNPKVQSVESIKRFVSENHVEGTVIIPYDSLSFNYLQKYFDFGNIIVFNHEGKVVENNFISLGGHCYSEVCNNIKGGFVFEKNNFKSLDSLNLLDSLSTYSIMLQQNRKIELKNKYDFIIVYGWVSFVKSSYIKRQLAFLDFLKNQKKYKVILVAVNTDYFDLWCDKDCLLPKAEDLFK